MSNAVGVLGTVQASCCTKLIYDDDNDDDDDDDGDDYYQLFKLGCIKVLD